jgi:hypothetical protein
MAFNAGKQAVFKLDNAAGSLQTLTTYLTSIEFSESLEELETTTLGSTNRSYLISFGDCEIKLSGIWDPTLDGIMAGLSAGFRAVPATVTSASFEYGPAGSTSSYVKVLGECVLTEYNRKDEVDGVGEFDATLHVSGNITVTTW